MHTNKQSKNYLFVGEAAGSTSTFFEVSIWRTAVVRWLIRSSDIQIALKFAERSQPVLFILPQPLESLPVESFKSLKPEFLKRIIFRYIGSFRELMKMLLEIHTWAKKPRLVLIDSIEVYFKDCGGNADEFADFFENHCLLAAAVQNAVDSLSADSKSTCVSVLSIDLAAERVGGFYKRMEEKFIDLYFYGDGRVVGEKSVRVIWEEAEGREESK